ncbi:transketolase [Polaribacter reichenbachii]|uniref:Transketolase n=1 Tax=Polaribacter reichenbachii TaxID=996801 RepID=A0A1B8TNP7_9FLAO|nr:transketolase [Polaribacter reichenbachii]APZ46672.1 transketolase [Polaribacter reichenbachii]AUC17315.1 transketolase [Polaribacter reichenbachii]OBY61237.1 transketolase [Polaribacter reichenbachii]
MTISELERKSIELRKKILSYIYNVKAGHTGGSLSCIDIINVLYNRVLNIDANNFSDSKRDRYIQSKGHCVEALFVTLADCGFFSEEDLQTGCQYKSHYIGHPTKKVNGIEQNTGALGHGLSICVGEALAAKMDNKKHKVFTLLGDGEMAEGSNWEAFQSAAHYKLDNLFAILDYNKQQISGSNKEVMNPISFKEKLQVFGWAVKEVDGHNIKELVQTLNDGPFEKEKPSFIIAHTIKGRGVSFMEGVLKWHHGVPTEEQYLQAQKELETLEQAL